MADKAFEMDETFAEEETEVKHESKSPFNEVRNNPMSAAFLKDNHLMNCCISDGIPEDDEKMKLAESFGRIIPSKVLEDNRLGIVKTDKDKLYKHLEVSRNLVDELSKRAGKQTAKVFKVFEAGWKQIVEFEATIERMA